VDPSSDYTLIKLTGTDRPELLLKVSAVITRSGLQCGECMRSCGHITKEQLRHAGR
jgi:hypothetical protein